MNNIETLKLALEYLQDNQHHIADNERHVYVMEYNAFIERLERIIAEAEQAQPAGWRPATFHRENITFNPGLADEKTIAFWKLLGVEIEYCYTTPPPRQPWVGLTDEEIAKIYMDNTDKPLSAKWAYTRAIEQALKEKNT